MSIFLSLFINLLPLYFLIGLGYFAGRVLKVDRRSLGTLAIYIFMPIVVFGFVADLDFQPSYIVLPIFIFIVSTLTGVAFLAIGKKVYKDNQANLLSMCTSMGNTGYFGIPLAIIFFPPTLADIYIFTVMASLLYESSTGFYVTAKGNFSVKESLKKISRLPILYAFILGIICNLAGLKIPEEISAYTAQFKGAYGILGMMMLGMGLLGLKSNPDNFDKKFISITFIIKFVFWPLAMLGFIYIDKTFDISVNNVPARVFFLSLVADAGINVVADPEMKGNISLELSNVSLKDVLNVCREVYG